MIQFYSVSVKKMFLHVLHGPGRGLTILFLQLLFSISYHEVAPVTTGEVAEGRNGIVATDETVCSRIGRNILRQGGHAVDAAVAATLCLGVKDPMASGLGGGGFILVRSSNGKALVIDMREMAPARASTGMYGNNQTQYITGPKSIAVPGQLAGLYKAHQMHGKLPWAQLVKPAKDLAGRGIRVSKSLHRKLVHRKEHIMADEELRMTFVPNGTFLSEGKFFKVRKLATTLGLISKHGMSIFYNGSLGKTMARDISKAGGIVTYEDLQHYEVKIRRPLFARSSGYEIVTGPPPAAGGAVMIMIQNILSSYTDNNKVPISLVMHRFVEALKFALAMRMDLGDPGFVNNEKTINTMISRNHTKIFRSRIKDNQTFAPSYYGSKWRQQHDQGTTHIVVIDRHRNVVSLTTSLNSYGGSKYMSPGTGLILNNHMYDFSYPSYPRAELPLAPANFIKPFKRPLSSMAPTILLKGGRVMAVLGGAGGMLIPDAVTQILIYYFARNLSPLAATMAPRLYHILHPNVLYYEHHNSDGLTTFPRQFLDDLRNKGHKLQKATSELNTVCQFVVQHLEGPKSGLLVGVSDPRKGGLPSAY